MKLYNNKLLIHGCGQLTELLQSKNYRIIIGRDFNLAVWHLNEDLLYRFGCAGLILISAKFSGYMVILYLLSSFTLFYQFPKFYQFLNGGEQGHLHLQAT